MTIKWALIIVTAIALFAGGFYTGRLGLKLADSNAEVHELTQNQKQETADDRTIAQEAAGIQAAESAPPPPAPVVRVCLQPARVVLSTGAAPGRVDVPADDRAANPPDLVPGPDIGGPLVQQGHIADVQIAELQDYIVKVCRPKGEAR